MAGGRLLMYTHLAQAHTVIKGAQIPLQPSYKHDGVLSHRPASYSLEGGALCFVSVIKAIGFRLSSLCLSLSNTHGHSDPEILLRAA